VRRGAAYREGGGLEALVVALVTLSCCCCCCCSSNGCSSGGSVCCTAAVPALAPSCASGNVDVDGARIIADARALVEAWGSCCVRSAGAARLLLGVPVQVSSVTDS
jgi:hypothetical protein